MIICHTRNKASRQAWCIVGYSNQRSIAVMNPEHMHTAGIVRTVTLHKYANANTQAEHSDIISQLKHYIKLTRYMRTGGVLLQEDFGLLKSIHLLKAAF